MVLETIASLLDFNGHRGFQPWSFCLRQPLPRDWLRVRSALQSLFFCTALILVLSTLKTSSPSDPLQFKEGLCWIRSLSHLLPSLDLDLGLYVALGPDQF